MRNLGKLLKQKTSMEFRWRGPGLGYTKEVVINGDHPEHHNALAPGRVIELLTGGQDAMREFTEAQGYTGLDDVVFYIEPSIRCVSISSDWGAGGNDAEIEVDIFQLIAKEK